MDTYTDFQFPDATNGMDRLVEKYRRQFRIPENLNYYSERDFQRAERAYLRFCLNRDCRVQQDPRFKQKRR